MPTDMMLKIEVSPPPSCLPPSPASLMRQFVKVLCAELEQVWQANAARVITGGADEATVYKRAIDAVVADAAAGPLAFVHGHQERQQALEAARAQPRKPIAARLVWSDDDEDDDTDLLHDARRGARRRLR
jgi:hypothetical protein